MSGPGLEPCPFCGGEMQIWEFGTQVRHAHDADGCPIRHLTLFRHRWNRRAPVDYAALPEVQALIAEAVKAEREACARMVDCGCDKGQKAAVIEAKNSADRARACGQYNCGAEDAAAIRKRGEG